MKSLTKKPQIETLIPDIYEAIEQGLGVTEENTRALADSLAEIISARLASSRRVADAERPLLSMSSIGRKDLYLWRKKRAGKASEEISGRLRLQFLYGDILEELMIFLARSAGHEVTQEQKAVKLEGIVGHKDCVVDGVTIDIKSASPFAFQKFKTGRIKGEDEDSFGYIHQVSGYAQADPQEDDRAALWAFNKVNAEMTLTMIEEFEQPDIAERIIELKKTLESDLEPAKCYKTEDSGKKGNKALPKNCHWCDFKEECWSTSNGGNGLRAFKYAKGIQYLTHVEDEPRVDEVTDDLRHGI